MNPLSQYDHSQLAMQAARRMRRCKHNKHKQKNSRQICYHLSKMLMNDESGTTKQTFQWQVNGLQQPPPGHPGQVHPEQLTLPEIAGHLYDRQLSFGF